MRFHCQERGLQTIGFIAFPRRDWLKIITWILQKENLEHRNLNWCVNLTWLSCSKYKTKNEEIASTNIDAAKIARDFNFTSQTFSNHISSQSLTKILK